MSLLPDIDRILLGPGPSLTAPRVMRAMAAPTVSHLDPLMMTLLDDIRGRLGRVFRAAEGSFRTAIEIARRQGAASLERRAAASLDALAAGPAMTETI